MNSFLEARMKCQPSTIKSRPLSVDRLRLWLLIAVVGVIASMASAAPVLAQIVGTAQLHVERRGHTATLLQDGKVLIVGGDNQSGLISQAEIFDPAVQTSSLAASASIGRTDHTATRLADGRVLIIGGRDQAGQIGSTEIYNPLTSSFIAGPSTMRARSGHTATVLADGRILIAGGDTTGSAEIYDPASQSFSSVVGSMSISRTFHGAARLNNGQVLIAGGMDAQGAPLNTAEIYDPQSQAFYRTNDDMGNPRAFALMRVLPDGKVQIIGGDSEFSMEVFDPQDGLFNGVALLPPNTSLLAATLSTHSRVALISPEISQDTLLQSVLTPEHLALLDRADHSITEIPQANQALVAGGLKSSGQVLSSATLVKSSSATITTDKTDYAPGEFVTITGTGFLPNEQVQILFHEFPDEYPDIMFNVTANQQGKFITAEFAPQIIDINRTFTLTAIGQTSSFTAQTAFTDGNVGSNISFSIVGAVSGNTTVAPDETLNWLATATCSGASTGQNSCASNGATQGGPVVNGYTMLAQESTNPGFGGATPRDTQNTSGGTGAVNGSFSAPTTPGIYHYRARHESQAINGNTWQAASSNGIQVTVAAAVQTFSVTFDAAPIGDVANGTMVLSVTIGAGAATPVTKGELPKTFSNIESGTNVSYAYNSPLPVSTNKRYRWNTTTGTGSALGQTAQAGSFSLTSNSTVSAAYVAQFQITFTAAGSIPIADASETGANTVATVAGNAKIAGNLPFSDWFDNGASVTFVYEATVASTTAGKRFALTGVTPNDTSSFTVSGAATYTGTYKTQYQLTLATNPAAVSLSNISGGTTGMFYDDGTVLSLAATTLVSIDATSRYRFDKWSGSVAVANEGNNPLSVTMNAPKSLTANYVVQYQLTFTAAGTIPIGGTSETGANTVVMVASSAKSAGNLPFSDWFDSGAGISFAYEATVASTTTGKRFVLTGVTPDSPSPFTVSGAATYRGTYKTQYQLTLATNPAPVGLSNISGGTTGMFYDAGTVLSLTATTPVTIDATSRYRFDKWSGDVAVANETDNPVSVTMNAPKSSTANYVVQYQLAFTAAGTIPIGGGSETGANPVVTVAGNARTAGNLPFSDWFDSGANISFAYETTVASTTAGKRFMLTGVTPNNTSPFTVSGPATYTGTYKTQYQLTFAQSGIGSDTGANAVVTVAGGAKTAGNLPFGEWFDAGASVQYSFVTLISTVPVSDKQYELTNAASLPVSPIAVTGPMMITGEYSLNIYSIHYLKPLDESTASSYLVNVGKNGRVIPVKIEIFKNGLAIETGNVVMRVAGSNCAAGSSDAPVEEYEDAGNSNAGTDLFRFNSGLWIYNLDTKALGLVNNNCYRLDVYYGTTTGPTAIKLSSSGWAIFKPVR